MMNIYKNKFRDPISDYNMLVNTDKLVKNIKNSYLKL